MLSTNLIGRKTQKASSQIYYRLREGRVIFDYDKFDDLLKILIIESLCQHFYPEIKKISIFHDWRNNRGSFNFIKIANLHKESESFFSNSLPS